MHGERSSLPVPLTSFVGRGDEIMSLSKLVSESRLVTVMGPGGAGKTRLALEVARELVASPGVRVVWADLASSTTLDEVVTVIADAVGEELGLAEPLPLLTKRLADTEALLVLDNCEHIAGGVNECVRVLLAGCPGLSVLATSRRILGVAGEVSWVTPPMSFPADDEDVDVGGIGEHDAVRLFLDRASRTQPLMTVDSATVEIVGAICRRLQGIPLAIELAAARLRVLSLPQVLAGLDDASGLLYGASGFGQRTGQNTVEASLSSSWSLINDVERTVLCRLSVFRAPFTLDAAEALAQLGRHRTIAVLEALVGHSLVQVDNLSGTPRYSLLEVLRQFGRERLDEEGETFVAEQAHAMWFRERATAMVELHGPRMAEFLETVDNQRADFLGALEWFEQHGLIDEMGALALGCLPALGFRRPRLASEWFDRVVTQLEPSRSALLARLLSARGVLHTWCVRVPLAVADAQAAFAVATEAGDDAARLEATGGLAFLRAYVNDSSVDATLQDLASEFEARGMHFWAMCARGDRHLLPSNRGDYRAAEPFLEDALAYNEAYLRCPCCRGSTRMQLARHLRMRGEVRAAAVLVEGGRADLAPLGAVMFDAVSLNARLMLEIYQGVGAGVLAEAEAADRRYAEQGMAGHVTESLLMALPLHGRAQEAKQLTMAFHRSTGSPDNPLFLLGLAICEHRLGNFDAAAAALARVDEMAARLPYAGNPTLGLLCRAQLAHSLQRVEEATDEAHAALRAAIDWQFHGMAVGAIELLAVILAEGGDAAVAGRLAGAAERRRDVLGLFGRLSPALPRPVVYDERFVAQGRSMPWDDAVALAQRGRGRRGRPASGLAALTRTERDVADAAASGLTNAEIAAKLLMGTETVKTHVAHVYTKLGVRSRAQLRSAIAAPVAAVVAAAAGSDTVRES